MGEKLLEIKNLSVEYHTDDDDVFAVNNVNLSIDKGETLGFVGETGAGKTTTCLSIMRLLPQKIGEVTSGDIFLNGESLMNKSEPEMRAIRGNEVSMIFQDPMTSLDPTMRQTLNKGLTRCLQW